MSFSLISRSLPSARSVSSRALTTRPVSTGFVDTVSTSGLRYSYYSSSTAHQPDSENSITRLSSSRREETTAFFKSYPPAVNPVLILLQPLSESDVFLDLGCGDGRVLGAALQMGAGRVVGIEQDARSCATARENLKTIVEQINESESSNSNSRKLDATSCFTILEGSMEEHFDSDVLEEATKIYCFLDDEKLLHDVVLPALRRRSRKKPCQLATLDKFSVEELNGSEGTWARVGKREVPEMDTELHKYDILEGEEG